MHSEAFDISSVLRRVSQNRGLLFSGLLIGALLAFEVFNYSTTDFALTDLLGDLRFIGLKWSTILALAFCGIDFAGIARIFTPEEGNQEPAELWYLFGAWLIAATMNALLTWWGVSIALLHHESLGNSVVAGTQLLKVVPVFMAVMVWLSRVLIIGAFSIAGERLFSTASYSVRRPANPLRAAPRTRAGQAGRTTQTDYHPVGGQRPEPKYEQMPMMAKPRSGNRVQRR